MASKAPSNDGIVGGLPMFLADRYLLMGKTQACRRNVTRPNVHGLHTLFEAPCTERLKATDVLAERIRALGSPAPMSIEGILAQATLKEPSRIPDVSGMVRMPGEDHSALSGVPATRAEEAGDDRATHDLLVACIVVHGKAAWMLRSHLS